MNWVPPSKNPKDCETLMTWVPLSNNWKDCENLSYKSIRLLLILLWIFWCPYSLWTPEANYFPRFYRTPLNNFLKCPEVIALSWKRVKHLSSLNFDRQFPKPFIFTIIQYNRKWKNGHYMPASYTLYLAHEAMGIFYIIHRCHHVSFLVCLHPIDPHWHKPHQKAFPLPKKGLGIPF